ncbi:hypothetical protein HK100_005495 [Physocladia obscura]|uniref:Uncharacterized protein n=1 Tax=Physocladia obscura TaxID=109957 RepID=A0AAD5TBP0_9FUNG|nr:hypothetical protein HK100_005495 [Physocladia obscura]
MIVVDGEQLRAIPGSSIVDHCPTCTLKVQPGKPCFGEAAMHRLAAALESITRRPPAFQTQDVLDVLGVGQISEAWLARMHNIKADSETYIEQIHGILFEEWFQIHECWRSTTAMRLIEEVTGALGASHLIVIPAKRTLITVTLLAEVVNRIGACCCTKWLDSTVPAILTTALTNSQMLLEIKNEISSQQAARQHEFDARIWTQVLLSLGSSFSCRCRRKSPPPRSISHVWGHGGQLCAPEESGRAVMYPSGKTAKVADRFHSKRDIGNAVAGPLWMDAFDVDQVDSAIKAKQVKTMYLKYLDADTFYVAEKLPEDLREAVRIVKEEELLKRAWVRQELILSNTYSILFINGDHISPKSLSWILLWKTIEDNANDTDAGEEALFLRMLLQKSSGVTNIGEIMREAECYYDEDLVVAAANVLQINLPNFTYGQGIAELLINVLNNTKNTAIFEGYINCCTAKTFAGIFGSEFDYSEEEHKQGLKFLTARSDYAVNVPPGKTLYLLESVSTVDGVQLSAKQQLWLSEEILKKTHTIPECMNMCHVNGTDVYKSTREAARTIGVPIELGKIVYEFFENDVWTTILWKDRSMPLGSWLVTLRKEKEKQGEEVFLALKDANELFFGIIVEFHGVNAEGVRKGTCVGGWWSSKMELRDWNFKLFID